MRKRIAKRVAGHEDAHSFGGVYSACAHRQDSVRRTPDAVRSVRLAHRTNSAQFWRCTGRGHALGALRALHAHEALFQGPAGSMVCKLILTRCSLKNFDRSRRIRLSM